MGKKIYVGNLPFNTTSETLTEMFASYGHVDSSKIIMDRESGRSKGFGFIEMSEADEADRAIEALNGSEYGGRALTVNEARPTERRAPSQSGGFSPRNDRSGSHSGMGHSDQGRW